MSNVASLCRWDGTVKRISRVAALQKHAIIKMPAVAQRASIPIANKLMEFLLATERLATCSD